MSEKSDEWVSHWQIGFTNRLWQMLNVVTKKEKARRRRYYYRQRGYRLYRTSSYGADRVELWFCKQVEREVAP